MNAINQGVADPWGMDRMVDAWNMLKIQLSMFNKIVVIPSIWYNNWSLDEKARICSFMR